MRTGPAVGLEALREHARGALWVLPACFVAVALVAGAALAKIDVGPDSPLAFQGTADDARNLLIAIAGTMVTVIALLLGLAVVALQLSSTQFSPRVLRNFLQDRSNQVVLGAFSGTFAYSAAGLFTVGVEHGERQNEFPRFSVTVALALLFVSLGLLVFFANHLAHSIQVDAIMRRVEHNALHTVQHSLLLRERPAPTPPGDVIAVWCPSSGYVQSVHMRSLVAAAQRTGMHVRLRPRVGEHIVAGSTLGWVWPARPGGSAVAAITADVQRDVRIGFERTFEQDAAFGLRQLVDIACKALSPAVNDPYTAIQAIDHLTVVFCAMAPLPLGDHVAAAGDVTVTVPSREFTQYLATCCGLIRRFGGGEPTVAEALLRMLISCVGLVHDPAALDGVCEQAELVAAEAERLVARPEDLRAVRKDIEAFRAVVAGRRASGLDDAGEHPADAPSPWA